MSERQNPIQVELNGKEIGTEEDFHEQIADLLDFPQYYGHNLDALWDVLTVDVERPVKLVWCDADISRDRLGRLTFGRIVDLLVAVRDSDIKLGWSDRFEFELM